MVQESRVKKSLKNAKVSLTFYCLTLVLSFFSRKVFLDSLGADFVGLTTTLQNLLGFLNLAELGVSTAIGYVLYKPIYEHNENIINEIISVFGYLYRCIGLIILCAGIILACFLPLIFPNSGFDLGIIYFAYFSFLISALIGYFINYRQTLLGADQKNYVVVICYQSIVLVKTIVQMTMAYYTGDYYLWVTVEIVFGVLHSIVLNKGIDRAYPWLRSEVKTGRKLFDKYPEISKYTKQLLVHKIASFVQYQTSPILIYSFVSLPVVTLYSNYTIVTDKLGILLNNILASSEAGVGNLIAENNRNKTISVFWELTSLRYFFACVFSFSIYYLMEPFICLWLGENYLMTKTILVLIIINVYVRVSLGAVGQFVYGYGLFYDTWSSLAQIILYIIFSIIGGLYLGLVGILIAQTLSFYVISGCWKVFFLFNKGFHKPVFAYWMKTIKYNFLIILACLISHFILDIISYNLVVTWTSLILYAIIVVLVISITSLFMLAAFTRGMKDFLKRYKLIIKNLI